MLPRQEVWIKNVQVTRVSPVRSQGQMTSLRRAYAAQTRSLNKKCPSDKGVPSEQPGSMTRLWGGSGALCGEGPAGASNDKKKRWFIGSRSLGSSARQRALNQNVFWFNGSLKADEPTWFSPILFVQRLVTPWFFGSKNSHFSDFWIRSLVIVFL